MKKIKTSFEDYYPFNILKDIQIDEEEIRKCSYDSIISAMQTRLTEREQTILELRYKEELTLKECGEKFGVIPERIRQIQFKALKKLRNPKCMKIMKPCAYEEHEELQSKKKSLNLLFIDSIGLSTRSYGCLIRSDIETVQDIIDYIKLHGTLRGIKNLGKKSMLEIYSKLSDLGIDLDTNKDIR